MKCSNYIGDAIDDGVRLKMDGLLLVGHIGKLVKIAAGVMNTHSRQADARMEVLAVHAAMAGADRETVCAQMCIRDRSYFRVFPYIHWHFFLISIPFAFYI